MHREALFEALLETLFMVIGIIQTSKGCIVIFAGNKSGVIAGNKAGLILAGSYSEKSAINIDMLIW